VKTTDMRGKGRSSSALAFLQRENRLIGALLILILNVTVLTHVVFGQAAVTTAGGDRRWSVEVKIVEINDASLDPSFAGAVYQNLIEELAKTNRFKQVFPDGHLYTDDAVDVLVLKTKIQPETAQDRKQSTVGRSPGTTKIDALLQLYTQDGRLLLNRVVTDDARPHDPNVRAGRDIARKIAATLQESTLPDPTSLVRTDETTKTPDYTWAAIVAVQARAASADGAVSSYKVTLKIGDITYVVLYAPPPGSVDNIRYGTGGRIHVLVGENTITFKDALGGSLAAPILSRAPKPAIGNEMGLR